MSLSLGIALSMIMFVMVNTRGLENRQMEFDSRAKVVADTLQNRFNEYVGVIQFVGDFFYNSSSVNRQEFSNFVKGAVYRYPAIQALAWAPLVDQKERSTLEAEVRHEGFPDFRILEMDSKGQRVPASIRNTYMVALYLYPFEENKEAMGFDIASESVRRQAIMEAVHTGMPTATHRLILVQEKEYQYSILILLPIFNEEIPLGKNPEGFDNLKGFVVEVLRIDDVVEGALSLFAGDGIDMALFDMSSPDEAQLLYIKTGLRLEEPKSKAVLNKNLYSPMFKRKLTLSGRLWEIRLTPSPDYIMAHKKYQSYLVLFGMVLLTFMMTFYMYKKLIYTSEIEHMIKVQIQSNQALESEISMRIKEELKLLSAKGKLENEIKDRVHAEKLRDKSISELTKALAEVRTLRGILPLCAYCKKIRDDKGYWEQVDVYIHKYSQADISHSICPQCMKEHFPDEFREMSDQK